MELTFVSINRKIHKYNNIQLYSRTKFHLKESGFNTLMQINTLSKLVRQRKTNTACLL